MMKNKVVSTEAARAEVAFEKPDECREDVGGKIEDMAISTKVSDADGNET